MQVKWLIPMFVGAALLSACGSGDGTASSTTVPATDLGGTAYHTIPPTQSTIPPATGAPAEGDRNPAEQEYTIQSGDYEGKVASRFGISVDELRAANVTTPNYSMFYPGLKIKIPAGALVPGATTDTTPTADPGASTPPATSAGPTTTLAPSGTCTPGTYVIAANDLPSTVAKKFDVTVAQLDEANKDTKGYKAFIVGVKINIPCA